MAKQRDEKKEARKFAVVLGIALGLLGGYFLYRGRETAPYICFAGGATPLFLAFVLPGVWLLVFRQWMKLAEAISWVMTRVILSTFYYFMLTPVGLFMRLIGKDPLDKKFKDGRASYWVDKPPNEYTVDRYRKQY